MRNVATVVALLAVSLGCSPGKAPALEPVSEAATREGRLAGVWKGKHPAGEADSGPSSNYLAKQVGGYTLTLDGAGTFTSDWRGLKREGRWSIEGATVKLHVLKVLGKTREEALSENKAGAKPAHDMKLFESSDELAITAKDTKLTLRPDAPGAKTVVFLKA